MKNLKEEDFEKRVAPKGTENICESLCVLYKNGCTNNEWVHCEGHDDMEYFVKKQPVDQSPAPITHETDIEYLREAVDRLTKESRISTNGVFGFMGVFLKEIERLEKRINKIERNRKPKTK